MDIPDNVNIITVIFACIFVIPILVGILRPLTANRIHRSFASLLGNVVLLASIILSIYLTRIIFSDHDNLLFLYNIFPGLRNVIESNLIWAHVITIIVLVLIIDGILHLLALPIYRYAFAPVSSRISRSVQSMGGFARRTIGGLWQLPKSLWLVLVFGILLNFYTAYFNSSSITQYANRSAPYQLVQQNVIQPLLNSSVVKDVRIIFNDSFKLSDTADGKFELIKYFNGVTLDEAIQSNLQIDAAAHEIVGSETDDKRKAHLIYLWICENVEYDNAKAASIESRPFDVSSGAAVAYTTRTGVCFDYACLYVAMCRAAGLKVRFITGLGFTGIAWGDHAWNQVYCGNGWINVDTTFGSTGINYFDRPNFGLDHKDAVVQGEW